MASAPAQSLSKAFSLRNWTGRVNHQNGSEFGPVEAAGTAGTAPVN